MKLIVGLGNPGREYAYTRHNVGFLVLDSYLGNVDWKEKFEGLYYSSTINGEKVVFLKPQTYMNLSGNSVREFVRYFKIELEDILIIHDDKSLPFGKIRLKKNTSDGGHNGIKSVTSSLNSDNYCRFKFGISSDICSKMLLKDFVLGRFVENEISFINDNKDYFKLIIDSFITDGIDKTMNKYNGSKSDAL